LDFQLSDEQQAFADLARQILEDGASHERMREIEAQDGPRFDPELWSSVAQSGLLGICIPETYGGAEQGFFELALVIEQIGRTAAPIPLFESIVLGALPLMQFGSEDQKKSLLPDVAEGKQILTAALVEDLADPFQPTTRATAQADGWRITGRKICVPAGQVATRILIPVTLDDDRVAVFIVDAAAAGVTLEPLDTTSGQPEASILLEDVSVGRGDLLGSVDDGAKIIEWTRQRATSAQCSLALGVCEEALRLTAEFTTSRKQFGEPIATFQAVGQRQADAYVDTEAIRLTSWQAAWRLAAGLDAVDAVAVAKYWASLGGQRVVHTAVHQHGGMGVDRDYPLHRHFLYAKQLELSLGGATHQLLKIGKMLADTPVSVG
jgi:alkylation response protein AidB-like acyl-CoA dehydrogenase